MAGLADAIELFVHLVSGSQSVADRTNVQAAMVVLYVLFGFACLCIWTKASDKDFSVTLTASAAVQLLGFVLLSIKVRATKSVAGISSKTLEMYALFFLTRLASTTVKSGYIPVDRSGRSVYQLLDLGSFFVVMQLLYCCHKTYKWTYQAEQDTMSCFPLIPPCIVLGYFVHADLNRSELFDTIWAVSTNIDTLAMLPQLWMMSKVGGQVNGCTAHFTAALIVSRAMSLIFWCTAYRDLADDGAHVAAQMIVVANGIQVLLAADFMYYYASAKWNGKSVRLPMQQGAQDI
jgi:ER lumen protein retaining receptor